MVKVVGRGSADFKHLVEYASSFTHVFKIIGDNDVQERKIENILLKFLQFKNDIRPTKVKFAGIMRQSHLDPVVMANNISFY